MKSSIIKQTPDFHLLRLLIFSLAILVTQVSPALGNNGEVQLTERDREMKNLIYDLSSLTGREPGDPNHDVAWNFLQYRLRSSGISYEAPLEQRSFTNRVVAFLTSIPKASEVKNIYARVLSPNSDREARRCVVLTAHYDAFHAGANDNASGVALVLSTIQQLSLMRENLAFDYYAVFTDLEEAALGGADVAFDYIRPRCGSIVANLTFDMIGEPVTKNLQDHVVAMTANLSQTTEPALDQLMQNNRHGLTVVELPIKWIEFPIGPVSVSRSDYRPYSVGGIPTLFFSTGMSWRYHTEHDQPANLDYRLIGKIQRSIFDFINQLEGGTRMNDGGAHSDRRRIHLNSMIYLIDKIQSDFQTSKEFFSIGEVNRAAEIADLYVKVRRQLVKNKDLSDYEMIMLAHDVMSYDLYKVYGMAVGKSKFGIPTPFYRLVEKFQEERRASNPYQFATSGE